MHPVLIDFGPFELHTYGFFLGVGILAAIFWPAWVARRDPRMSESVIYDLGMLTFVGAVVGSRLEYVRTHWSERFADDPMAIFAIRDGGYVFYGGLIVVLGLCLGYLALKKIPLGPYADVAAPAICIGQAFGRMGCFFAGCCYGRPTDLPWAVTFPAGAIAPQGIALHPTQLYEVTVMTAMCAALMWYRKRVRFVGENLLIYAMAYPAWRSVNELFRGDAERGFVLDGITNGQMTSALMAGVAAVVWVTLRRRAASSQQMPTTSG